MNSQRYTDREINLHTHSFYCGHGHGHIAEYVQAAASTSLKALGFSEHCPFPDDRYRSTRMAYADRQRYEADVASCQGAGDLKVLLGYECDYHRCYHQYLAETGERVDYLIGAVHYLNLSEEADDPHFSRPLEKRDLPRYADRYCQMLQSGLFLFGAHPDLFTYNYRRWDEETEAISRAILACAVSEGIALEINGYGLQKKVMQTEDGFTHTYPHPRFWALAAEYPDLLVVTSSDAHKPGDVAYGIEETAAIAHENGLRLAAYFVDGRSVTIG